MAINFTTQESKPEISVQEPQETCTDSSFDYKVRKETTISHYEVAENGESWWETLFYTENWGTLNSAVKRYCGFNCAPYRERLDELMLELKNKGIKAILRPSSYRLILKIDKQDVRPDYAFKNRGRAASKES